MVVLTANVDRRTVMAQFRRGNRAFSGEVPFEVAVCHGVCHGVCGTHARQVTATATAADAAAEEEEAAAAAAEEEEEEEEDEQEELEEN